MTKTTIITLFAIFFVQFSYAQSITGFVYDEYNNPIPFARVYVKNFTNLGAITDEEGKYFFGCDLGSYEVIYKSLGYEDQEVKVTVSSVTEPTVQNVWLVQEENQLGTVEVSTKKKNYGWEITKQVIDNKKNMLQQLDSYTCEIYIKGVETYDRKDKGNTNEEEEDPNEDPDDKFQKQKDEIDNKINGDGQRLNMVEINLTKHFQYPNKIKEIRTGYDKIGRPDQIYFQSTVTGDFNFYESLIRKDDLHQTPIVSPLHPSGILSYKYKLREIITTEKMDTIYRVEIKSRSVGTSTMEGHIWIMKNEWVLTKVDLELHKGNLKIYDNFRIIQEFEKFDSIWLLKKQEFIYDTKYGRETVKGNTTVVYSDYVLNPTFDKKFFSNEVGVTTKEAYERDSSYWDKIRPVPLTPEEQRKKFVQDSLRAIYTSEVYLDSLDSAFNSITWMKALIFGFEHRNRHTKTQWYFSSVADFWEPVQPGGMRIGPGFEYFKKWEDEQWIDVDGDYTIGFNNWDSRGRLRLYHRYMPKKFATWSVWGAREVDLINPWNSIAGTIDRNNWYMNNKGGVWHRIEIINGLFISTGASFEHRMPFDSTYKFNTKFDDFWQQTSGEPIQFEPYNALRTNVGIQFTPFQKYMSEPYRKIILGSLWPTFSFYWEKGYSGILNSVVDFDYVSFSVEQEFQIGTMGKSLYQMRTGKFINKDSVFLIDKKFFRESDQDPFFRYLFIPPLWAFQNIDSTYQTEDFYVEGHIIHHFNGAIINKIPFMKKTGIQCVVGAGALYLPEHEDYFYWEVFAGVERTFKFLRRRLRLGAFVVYSAANSYDDTPDNPDSPFKPPNRNLRFKFAFDVMNERDLKFNF